MGNGFCGRFVDDAQEIAWNSGLNPYALYQDCHTAVRFEDAIQTRYHVDLQNRYGKPISQILGENFGVVRDFAILVITTVTNRL